MGCFASHAAFPIAGANARKSLLVMDGARYRLVILHIFGFTVLRAIRYCRNTQIRTIGRSAMSHGCIACRDFNKAARDETMNNKSCANDLHPCSNIIAIGTLKRRSSSSVWERQPRWHNRRSIHKVQQLAGQQAKTEESTTSVGNV